jgi:pectate lyase
MTLNRRDLLALAALPAMPVLSGCATTASAADAPLGWAGVGKTTGGAGARPEHVFDVRDRAGLDAALKLGDTPKIIRVHTLIDLGPGGVEAFRDPAFSFDAFDRAYDPATWGRADPAGPLQDARERSAKRQAATIVVRVPSNTTLIGVAPGAGFQHGTLLLNKVENVIVRDLDLSDAYDHFPAWEPRDNGHGEWNSEYDPLSITGARRVWVDHCSLSDGSRPDHLEPVRLGRRVQHHDGLLDITHGGDLVTVSWCRFSNHDKTMLIGGNEKHTEDIGKLRVTLHHNHFHGCKERTPRVRYGRVHVACNLFSADRADDFGYSLGVGFESRIVAESNAWELPAGIAPSQLLRRLKGTALADRGGNRLNGQPVTLTAEGLSADVGWRPEDVYDTTALRPGDGNRLVEQIRAGAGPRRA